ncbi:hypothetical protein [Antarcticirhabdus aurantiaca]|uniref:Uncharacterized protein n=1 Tax=Antarcticirhabdus aurantiaca TaxID=2606717 RepID=A0ACD4NS33_9HYPH|nr:hypothetical protein [Antarcticirhabdus aurantiaca]WAJ29552.1 hypothetical protein OXU80_04775 [Jeongeuplla avenae]
MDDRNKPTNASNSDAGITETDLAQERMGNNQIQGNDQENVHNQRQAVPDVKTETEGVVESFENMDPETRAKRENGG